MDGTSQKYKYDTSKYRKNYDKKGSGKFAVSEGVAPCYSWLPTVITVIDDNPGYEITVTFDKGIISEDT